VQLYRCVNIRLSKEKDDDDNSDEERARDPFLINLPKVAIKVNMLSQVVSPNS